MTPATHPARACWRVLLLAALTVVLALLLPAVPASAATLPAAETRVGVSGPATAVVVGVHECITAGQRPVRGPSQPQIAVGNCVAAEAAGARLPAYSGGKTQGIFDSGSSQVDLISGYKGPSANLPLGTPGMNGNIKSHVEAHAVALMRQQGLNDATLYINRVPCAGVRGCDAMLPRMLPEGAQLHVYGPNGFRQTYTGLPD